MRSEAASVEQYLAALSGERRDDLARLGELIREAVPAARELMKYGHPHYELDGPLFAMAAQKHHLALYVAVPEAIEAQAARIGTRNIGKGCIRFTRLGKLDLRAVRAILTEAAARRRAEAGSRG